MSKALGPARRRRGRHRQRRAGRPLGRADLQGLAVLRRRGRGGALPSATCSRPSPPTAGEPRAPPPSWWRSNTRCVPAVVDPAEAHQAGRAAGQSQARQCAAGDAHRARRRRRRARGLRPCGVGHLADPAHRAPLSRAGNGPGGARSPTGGCISTARARAFSTTARRSRRCSAFPRTSCSSNWCPTAAPSAASEDMTIQAQTALLRA